MFSCHGCNLNGVCAGSEGRDGFSADSADARSIVEAVTGAFHHGVETYDGQRFIREIAVAEVAFPVFHIAVGEAGLLHSVVASDSAVAEGDGCLRFGARVAETSAADDAGASDGNVAFGIDRVGGAELRIIVRADLLSPGAFGRCALQQIGHHATLEFGGGVACGLAADSTGF